MPLHYMSVQEIIDSYYPSSSVEFFEGEVIDVNSDWSEIKNEKLEHCADILRDLQSEYINNGFRFRTPIELSDEEDSTIVNNGHNRVVAVKDLLDRSLVCDSDALLPVSSSKDMFSVWSTGEIPCGDYLYTYEDSLYSFCLLEFIMESTDSASSMELADKAIVDEDGIWDKTASFKVNDFLWSTLETGGFNKEKRTGSLYFALDFNASKKSRHTVSQNHLALLNSIEKMFEEYVDTSGFATEIFPIDVHTHLQDLKE